MSDSIKDQFTVSTWVALGGFATTVAVLVFGLGQVYGTMEAGFRKYDDQYQSVIVKLSVIEAKVTDHQSSPAHPNAQARIVRIEDDFKYIRARLDSIARSIATLEGKP